jgi:L-asparaginase
MMSIKLLLTGGTIDKHYHELTGELSFKNSHIDAMLQQARCQLDLSIQQLFLKDSLEMNDADRRYVLKACQNSLENHIVITHGTDTMVKTAGILAPSIQAKTIVLLGAMIPYSLKHSDSLFNLGAALAAVQCLEAGVYITMNGKVFRWDQVQKNRQLGQFQTKT